MIWQDTSVDDKKKNNNQSIIDTMAELVHFT